MSVFQENQENKYAIDSGSSVCVFFLNKKTDRSNRIRIESRAGR